VLADVVAHLMIHDVDLARAIAGHDVVEAHSTSRNVHTLEADFASALAGLHSGMVTTITTREPGKVRRLTLTQRENGVIADPPRRQVAVHCIKHTQYLDDGALQYRHRGPVEIPLLSQHGEPLMPEFRHFTKCVLTRSRFNVNGEDGLAAVTIRLALRDVENAE
jgi:predicted dehydrogenase